MNINKLNEELTKLLEEYEDGDQEIFYYQALDSNGNYMLTAPEQDTYKFWQNIEDGETLENAIRVCIEEDWMSDHEEVSGIDIDYIDEEENEVLVTINIW